MLSPLRRDGGSRALQPPRPPDDLPVMTIDEELIREVLLRSSPSDLDDLLTTIEAYRTCVTTAHRLRRSRGMQEQRDQVLDCAGFCRKALQDYAATGKIPARYPASGEAHFTFTLG
jgi:hypothetical protein